MENTYTAEKCISTPEDWATGFQIEVKDRYGSTWLIEGIRRDRLTLFDDSDRKEMNELRDTIIHRLS